MLAFESYNTVELKKHVGAIHSSNKLTLVQRKIANALLFNAYDVLHKNDEYEIHIGDLCHLIGYASNDYKKIKNSLKLLISTVLEWNLVDKENGDKQIWNASAILASASIDGPICTYAYSPRLKALLFRPEVYGRINMLVQSRFKSTYGLALYENCVRYQNIPQTPWFEMPLFRKLMGVEEGKYPIFRDFKRRVLDKAVEEVNTHSPINIEPVYRKRARKVLGLQFKIIKGGKALPSPESTDDGMRLLQQLTTSFGVNTLQTEQLLSQYGVSYIAEKVALIETSVSYQNGKIKNLGAYLIKALAEDYQAPRSSMSNVVNNAEKKQAHDRVVAQEKQCIDAYHKYRIESIWEYFKQLNKSEQTVLEAQFSESIKNNICNNFYVKYGLEEPIVKDKFCEYLLRHQATIASKIKSYTTFKTEQLV